MGAHFRFVTLFLGVEKTVERERGMGELRLESWRRREGRQNASFFQLIGNNYSTSKELERRALSQILFGRSPPIALEEEHQMAL
jgi:hypothetical protein